MENEVYLDVDYDTLKDLIEFMEANKTKNFDLAIRKLMEIERNKREGGKE